MERVYLYGMRARGCSPGAQPDGFIDFRDVDDEIIKEEPIYKAYHSLLYYPEPLSMEEANKYELDDLGAIWGLNI